MPEWIATREASELLGMSIRGVRALIERGRLKAVRVGSFYMVARASVKTLKKLRRKRANPRARIAAE